MFARRFASRSRLWEPKLVRRLFSYEVLVSGSSFLARRFALALPIVGNTQRVPGRFPQARSGKAASAKMNLLGRCLRCAELLNRFLSMAWHNEGMMLCADCAASITCRGSGA